MAFVVQEQNISSWLGSGIPAGQRHDIAVNLPKGERGAPLSQWPPGCKVLWPQQGSGHVPLPEPCWGHGDTQSVGAEAPCALAAP